MLARLAPTWLLCLACGTAPTPPDAGLTLADAGPSKEGLITLRQLSVSGVAGGTVTASFGTTTIVGCTHQVEGACTIDLCGVNASATDTHESAGVLTLSGPTLATLRLSPSLGQPVYSSMTGALWSSPNETITVVGAGAAVPAFAQTISAPSAVTVTQPVCSLSATCAISRAAPFTVSWSGGSVGSVRVNLFSEQGTSPTSAVSCVFPASAGSGTIPATVMGALLSGTGSIAVGGSTTSTFVAGDYAITLATFEVGLIASASF